MLAITFSTEVDAYEGLTALKELETKGDIVLYASAVVVKDITGQVSIRQAEDSGPLGTAVGMITGALVGTIAGPVGAAVGTTAGALSGSLVDIGDASVNADFLDTVSTLLLPGTTVLLAEVEEEWTTPVDARIAQLDGRVFRRSKQEVIDDLMLAESIALNEELEELQTELKESSSEKKASIQEKINSTQKKLDANRKRAAAELDKTKRETAEKIDALKAKMANANEQTKAKLEKKIADVKADQKERSEKLGEAKTLTKEALTP